MIKLQQRKGFSILEVLVATSISVIILTAVISLIVYSTRVGRLGEHKLQASALAQESLEVMINIKESGWEDFFAYEVNKNYYPELAGTPAHWTLVQNDDGQNVDMFNRKILIKEVWRYNYGHAQVGQVAPAGDSQAYLDFDSREVETTIGWLERGNNKDVTSSTYINNWRYCSLQWPYNESTNYSYDTKKIEIFDGRAQLINRSSENIDNGNFETGSLSDWLEESYTIWDISNVDPVEGAYYASTQADSSMIGRLKSNSFVSIGEKFKFQIKGYRGSNNGNQVTLNRVSDNTIVYSVLAPDNPAWQEIEWDLLPVTGQDLYIRAIDNSNDITNAWIAIDDFRQTDSNGNLIQGYAVDVPTIQTRNSKLVPSVDKWIGFSEAAEKNGEEIYYQLSNDQGATWIFWNGASWQDAGESGVNTASEVNLNIGSFPQDGNGVMIKAFLESDGDMAVRLDENSLTYEGECSGREILYVEEFSDGDAVGWDEEPDEKVWTVESGEYRSGPDGEYKTRNGDENWKNYRVSMDVRLTQGDGFGIYFRVNDYPTFRGYKFEYNPVYAGGSLLLKKVDGSETILDQINLESFDWYGGSNNFEIEAVGSSLAVYLNGSVDSILQATDNTFSKGNIGLYSWDSSMTYFDNIYVTEP